MVENKSGGKLICYALILFFMFLALVKIFISDFGNFFRLELLGFIFLLLLTFIGFVGYSQSWGERVLFFVFAIE